MNDRKHYFAYLCAVLNAVIIGLSFLFTKVALQYADPVDTLAYRFSVSVIVIAFPVLFGRIQLNFFTRNSLLSIFLLALMYPLLFFAFQTFGLKQTTSAEGGIIYAFTPILTTLLASIFLKERTTLLQKLTIVLSITGVVWIFVWKGVGVKTISLSGFLLLFLSCLTFAGYSVLARSLLKNHTPTEISTLMLSIGCVTFMIFSVSRHVIEGTMIEFIKPLSSIPFLLSILYLGVLSTLITSLTANYALSKLKVSQMSVFANLSTVVSIVAGALLLNEQIHGYHVIGSVFIIVGVIGTNMKQLAADRITNKSRELISK